MSVEKFIDELAVELRSNNFRNGDVPPVRLIFPALKANSAKLAAVAIDQNTRFLPHHKVIMFVAAELGCWLDAQRAGHAKMNAEPIILRKSEKHAFTATFRTQQGLAA